MHTQVREFIKIATNNNRIPSCQTWPIFRNDSKGCVKKSKSRDILKSVVLRIRSRLNYFAIRWDSGFRSIKGIRLIYVLCCVCIFNVNDPMACTQTSCCIHKWAKREAMALMIVICNTQVMISKPSSCKLLFTYRTFRFFASSSFRWASTRNL